MKKREQGILTVEASIVLTLCILFMLFLFSFARVYNAQSMVSHAVLQSSDAVALESYLREETLTGSESDVTELANRFMGTASISTDSYTSLRSADVPKIVKEKFVYAIDKNETEADEKLKKLGVKDGLAGIDFSGSHIDLGNDDVIVYVNYTIKMQFGVFGMDEISVTKAAKSKTFGDILFDISVVPDDAIMGSASGSGSYKYGTQVQISATPNYGYKFKKWSDGNTDNPRTVTVSGPKTYVAEFIEDQFGINTNVYPSDAGSVSGGGTYNYLSNQTITANPNIGYHFAKWEIYSHKDRTISTDNVSGSHSITVDQSYTCTAYFNPNSYNVAAMCEGGPSNSYAKVVIDGSASQSVSAEYKSSFKLTASSLSGYEFLGWKIEGSSNYFSASPTVNMTVGATDTVYVACYRSTTKTVRFLNQNGTVFAIRTVSQGNSLGGNMPSSNPYNTGYRFNGWQNFGSNTVVWNDMDVYPSWKKCTHHKWGNCGVKHSLGGKYWWPKTDEHGLESHYTSWASCIRCVYCQQLDSSRVLCGTHWEKGGASYWGKYAQYCGPNDCGAYNLP